MANAIKILLSATFLILSFCSCSTQRLDDEIDHLKINLKDLRSIQAEQTTKISALEDEVRKITGSIQEVQYATDQKIGRSIEDLQGDVSLLRKRVPPPSIVPDAELAKDEEGLAGLPSELSGPVSQGLQDRKSTRLNSSHG